MTRSRAKGTRLERIAKRRLEEKGYVVIRAAASRGPFDLVALKSTTSTPEAAQNESGEAYPVLCVQVKANRKPTKDQVEVMSNFSVASEVWVHRDRVDAWDVYEPTSTGVEFLRQEPYAYLPRG